MTECITYNPLTKEGFGELLKELSTDGISATKREWVVETGRKGYDQYIHALEKSNALDALDWLANKECVTAEQKESMVLMINSPDHEDFNLALAIIKIKQDEHLHNRT